LFGFEGWCSIFFQNSNKLIPDYTVAHPRSWKLDSWMLHHNSALHLTTQIPHWLYSPDLSHSDVCLVPKLKNTRNGRTWGSAVSYPKSNMGIGFVVDKVVLGQVFSKYFGFPCQFLFHWLLHTHHLSSRAGTIGQLVANIWSGRSLTPPEET
jgi:hypothetical protein